MPFLLAGMADHFPFVSTSSRMRVIFVVHVAADFGEEVADVVPLGAVFAVPMVVAVN